MTRCLSNIIRYEPAKIKPTLYFGQLCTLKLGMLFFLNSVNQQYLVNTCLITLPWHMLILTVNGLVFACYKGSVSEL